METRLTDLEIRLTHQEAALDEMNSVLLKQYKLIEELRGEMATLQRQLQDMGTGIIANPAEETPPHY
jgi:SlyX protein